MIDSYRTSELPTLCCILASVLGGAGGSVQAVSELRAENDKWQTRETCEVQPQHTGCHRGRLRRRKHLNWAWEEVFRRKRRGQRLRRKDIQAEIYEKHTRPGNGECVPWDLTGNHSLGRPGKARETTSAHCTLLARQSWQGDSKCRPFSEGSG